MPTISVEQNLLKQIMEKHGLVHDIEVLSNRLPLLGTDIDSCTESLLDIEIFPNRPDLLSGETLARAIRNFIHDQEANPKMEVTKGDISLTVSPELKHIRPIILGAVVRGVSLAGEDEIDSFIKSLMDHQEKESPRL